jgi:hypothetical protein
VRSRAPQSRIAEVEPMTGIEPAFLVWGVELSQLSLFCGVGRSWYQVRGKRLEVQEFGHAFL